MEESRFQSTTSLKCFAKTLDTFVFLCLGALLLLPNESLASSNKQPGLEFKPEPPQNFYERTLIWYNGSNFRTYTDSLDDFLQIYKTPVSIPGYSENIYNCDYTEPPPRGKICDIDLRDFGPCTQENFYNFHKSAPCIFLKLKSIPGWIPEYYNDTSNLPETMPSYLKALIKRTEIERPFALRTLWVSCDGVYPADIEFIGPVKYYPRSGFPGYFFPMENEAQYLSPLVAVQFQRATRGVIINIECKMWARNIHHDREKALGLVHFELMLD